MKKKKGFTLVELLAVIVILAIILVIAVPQIMDTIDSARDASLESSAKMVAAQVENQHTVSQTLGTNFASSGDCTTAKWAGLNDKDYESCTYSIDSNGKASVTLVGKGKFEGKNICDGTRTSAKVTEESCGLVCAAGTTKVVKSVSVVRPYEVKNVESCEDYFTNYFINDGAPQEIVDSYPSTLCSGGGLGEEYTFTDYIEELIEYEEYTLEELIENEVVGEDSTDTNVTIGDPTSCFNYTKEVWVDKWKESEEDLQTLCSGEVLWDITLGGFISFLIEDEGFTEQELIENNVIKGTIEEACATPTPESCFAFYEYEDGRKVGIAGYDISCGTDVVIPETINEATVTEIGSNAFTTYGEEVVAISNRKNIYPSKLNGINYSGNLNPIGTVLPGEGIGITSVVIPNTVTTIQDYVFRGNLITNLTIPSSVTYVGFNAFAENPLTNVHLGNLGATINPCAFGDITTITTHNIPASYVCE